MNTIFLPERLFIELKIKVFILKQHKELVDLNLSRSISWSQILSKGVKCFYSVFFILCSWTQFLHKSSTVYFGGWRMGKILLVDQFNPAHNWDLTLTGKIAIFSLVGNNRLWWFWIWNEQRNRWLSGNRYYNGLSGEEMPEFSRQIGPWNVGPEITKWEHNIVAAIPLSPIEGYRNSSNGFNK